MFLEHFLPARIHTQLLGDSEWDERVRELGVFIRRHPLALRLVVAQLGRSTQHTVRVRDENSSVRLLVEKERNTNRNSAEQRHCGRDCRVHKGKGSQSVVSGVNILQQVVSARHLSRLTAEPGKAAQLYLSWVAMWYLYFGVLEHVFWVWVCIKRTHHNVIPLIPIINVSRR